MKYNLTGKTRGLQVNNYMELASSTSVQNNFIINSICCFGCREYCKSEYTTATDWLTRQEQKKKQQHPRQRSALGSSFNKKRHYVPKHTTTTRLSHSSLPSPPPPPFYVLNVNKHDASTTHIRHELSPPPPPHHHSQPRLTVKQQHSLSFGKYYFLNSKKTKFKRPPQHR